MNCDEPPPSQPFGRDETWITLADALTRAAAADFPEPKPSVADVPAQPQEQD